MRNPMRQTEHSGRLVTRALNTEIDRLRDDLARVRTNNGELAKEMVRLREENARLQNGLQDCDKALDELHYWIVKSGVEHPKTALDIAMKARDLIESLKVPS